MTNSFFTPYSGHSSAEITVNSSDGLADAVAALQAGTGGTIRLDHTGGPYQLDAFGVGSADAPILITSLDPNTPAEFNLLDLSNSSYLTFDCLSFVNTRDTADFGLADFTIRLNNADHIEFTSNAMTGSASEMALDASNNGGSLAKVTNSEHISFLDNTISNYFHGPTIVDSENIILDGNRITKMQGDGIRGGGLNDATISNNEFYDFLGALQTVTHNDMIQLWGRNVADENRLITIECNILDARDGIATQGIFIRNETFGEGGPSAGLFEDITIKDNVIYNGRFQGIAIRDTRNAVVENNSVLWNTDSAHQEAIDSEPLSTAPAILGTNLQGFEFGNNIADQVLVNGALQHADNLALNYQNPNAFEYVDKHIVGPDEGAGATLDDLAVRPDSPFYGIYGAKPTDGPPPRPPKAIDAQFGEDDATSFRLTGTSNIDYDEAPIALSGVEALSISLGFKMDQTPDADGHVIRLPGMFGLNTYDHGGFKFRLVTEDGAFQVQAPVGTLSDGEYHDIRIDYDSGLGTLSLFVDDVLVSEVPATGATVDASNQDVILGASFGSSAEGYVQYFCVIPEAAPNTPPVAADLDVTGDEDSVLTGQLLATDVDGDPLSYVLTSMPDTGAVELNEDGSFTYTPTENFFGSESFNYIVMDGNSNSDAGVVTLNVLPVNDLPVFTSPTALALEEDTVDLPAVEASDIDGDTLEYEITGGADAAFFALDAETGALSFLAPPDFEAPADANGDNQYELSVSATDGTTPVTQDLTVTVTDSDDTQPDDGPLEVFIFDKSTDEVIVSVENGGVVDSALLEDVEITIVAFVVGDLADEGGVGSIKISFQNGQINRTESISPYALFGDDTQGNFFGGIMLEDGSYDIDFKLFSEARGQGVLIEEVDFSFTVAPAAVNQPPMVTPDFASTDEDVALFSVDVLSNDVDPEGEALELVDATALNGAVTLNGDGTFDYTPESDFNGTDIVTYTVEDASGAQGIGTLEVAVTAVNDAPVIVSAGTVSVVEGDTEVMDIVSFDIDGDALSYALEGDDAAAFDIDAETGALSFDEAPDFETPLDADADGTYELVVSVSDGSETTTQSLAVSVTELPQNQPPTFLSADSFVISENSTPVGTVNASDPEGAALDYALAGGDDAALFTIDNVSGALSFVAPPDFELPLDASGDNIYDVTISANDGFETALQDITVTVSDVVEEEPPLVNVFNGTASGKLGPQADAEQFGLELLAENSAMASLSDEPDLGEVDRPAEAADDMLLVEQDVFIL